MRPGRTSLLALAALAALAAAASSPAELRVVEPGSARGTDPIEVASNMGFLCRTELNAVEGFANIYVVAVPANHGLGDIASTAAPMPCEPAGGPDGVVNADDLLCSFWTSRQGSMSVSRRDEPTETWQTRTALRDPVTGDIVFMGSWIEPLVPFEAFLVQASHPEGGGGSAFNPVTIVGSSNPAYRHDLQLPPSGNAQVTLLNRPYHTMQRTADEVFCGLEELDWRDDDGDGNPDACPNGIFDEVSGAEMTLHAFDNVPDGGPTDNRWITRTVRRDAAGNLEFTGTDFELAAPHGYVVTFGPPFGSSVYAPPHF